MTFPAELKHTLLSTPDTLSAAVRFVGTGVPVEALLDTIICGESLDFFLDDFPDVSRAQATSVLTWERIKIRAALGLDQVS